MLGWNRLRNLLLSTLACLSQELRGLVTTCARVAYHSYQLYKHLLHLEYSLLDTTYQRCQVHLRQRVVLEILDYQLRLHMTCTPSYQTKLALIDLGLDCGSLCCIKENLLAQA